MEDNKRETPFVYNIGDRLKYIHGKGEMITVADRRREYNKKTGTAKNIYLLTIENYEGYGYITQDWASEKYMMANMRRVYSVPKDPKAFLKKEFNVPKDIITEAFDFTAKYMECREDDNVIKEFFNPEDFEKKSNDALSCGYHETLEEENEKWKRFYARLNEENKDLKEINKGLRRQLDIRDSMLDKKSISYKQWTDTMDENKMINGENEALKMDNKELRELNEGLGWAFENMKRENEKLKNEIQAMKDELKESNEIQAMKDELKESENADLKNENAFLRHKLREVEAQRDKVINERDIFEEKNAKLMQKITCAEKQLDECAKRIYEALGHLSTVACNK